MTSATRPGERNVSMTTAAAGLEQSPGYRPRNGVVR
jgi:hypothetical protein